MPDTHVQPGFEDTWYHLWRERRLPVNVDPFDARLDDELERERLRKIFTQGLDAAVGYALPLAASDHGWRTGPWLLRDGRMYLFPGDSAMGYRLPLDSLPWVTDVDYPYLRELDPMVDQPQLPSSAQAPVTGRPGVRPQYEETRAAPVRGQSARGIIRTALCTEARNGVLYVFMPPVPALEDYLELVASVEATAAALGMPILLEGYPPPSDPRLRAFQITPDPGVLEVNVQPAASWDELVEQTTTLYEEARQTRLTPEKFMKDGRHVGTGGGNHFVLGGATPADSPFLRRPDLLRSLVGYWHNHPSLSYLLSGLFLGPTSQAPRVDEARHDSVYELEIAFAQIPERDRAVPPWLVDRVFRHLLADMTGNTHRAEFCIDKLYSPDSSSGRKGLLELRAFEMPPHARMSLAQQLLLRALVARFWRDPYEARLTRWGTELHDRFMLPFFVQQDFEDVLEELSGAGLPIETEWFAPHFAFRFPLYGDVGDARHPSHAPAGARAVARARRGRCGGHNGALRGFVGGTAAGDGDGPDTGPPRRDVQRLDGAAAADRTERRVPRGRPLPRVAAGGGAASDDSGPGPAHLRHRRHLARPLARRLRVPRDAPGRTKLRSVPGEQP